MFNLLKLKYYFFHFNKCENNLLSNKLDKIYKIKYLFNQKLFRINPSSVLDGSLKMDWFQKAFAWINTLHYISCLLYNIIYHGVCIRSLRAFYMSLVLKTVDPTDTPPDHSFCKDHVFNTCLLSSS